MWRKKKSRCMLYVACLLCLMLMVSSMVFYVKEEAWAETVLSGQTANQIVQQMGIGWNLGNTFDATGGNAGDIYSYEQSWGNPIVTKALIQSVKNAGFTTIRIPVTWYRHLSSDGSYTIDPNFIARVKTVVDYAYGEGLFVILNVHHEEWLNTSGLAAKYEQIGTELSAVWSQLAYYFADYDQHLIFEGMNEPRMSGTAVEWTGTQEAYAAVNYLNQVFVNTVRTSNKGYNQERCLMIPGYAASSSETVLRSIAIPTVNGRAANNIIISVHCYSPYNFCLSDTMTNFNTASSECTSEIDALFHNLQTVFLDNGIPVVIGETGATNKNNTAAREKWAYYMGNKAASYGIPIVLWDNGVNGASGGECHAYINRSTAQLKYPTIIQAMLSGKNSVIWGSGRTTASDVASLIGGSVIWANKNGLTSTSEWDSAYIVIPAKQFYYMSGREIAVVYTGSGEAKMVLDSAEKSAWWIFVEPDRVKTVNGKKVACFTYDDMLSAMKQNGVSQPSQLRNMCILAVNGSITTYEVSTVGGAFTVTYKANGSDYFIGTAMPSNPVYKNMTFGGWYTTMDYQAGTEYTGGAVSKDTTVYAKFNLSISFQPYAKEALPEMTTAEPTKEAETTKKAETTKEAEATKASETTKETETTKVSEATKEAETTKISEITEEAETTKVSEITEEAETTKTTGETSGTDQSEENTESTKKTEADDGTEEMVSDSGENQSAAESAAADEENLTREAAAAEKIESDRQEESSPLSGKVIVLLILFVIVIGAAALVFWIYMKKRAQH